MQAFNIADVKEGKVNIEITRSGGGSGQFAKIRAIAAKHLQKKGTAILLRDLVREVKEVMKFDDGRKAHNYTRNAVKSGYALENINGVVFVIKA